MALIKCPECQREVSDKAKNCPHCGYPLELREKEKTEPQRKNPKPEKPKEPKKEKTLILMLCAALVMITFIVLIIVLSPKSDNSTSCQATTTEQKKKDSVAGKYRLGKEGDNNYILTLNEDGTATWYLPYSNMTMYGYWNDESYLNDNEKAIHVKVDFGGYQLMANGENLSRVIIDDFLLCEDYAYQDRDKRKSRNPNYRVPYRKIEEEEKPTTTINPPKRGVHKPDSIIVSPAEEQTMSQLAINGEDYYYIEDDEGNSYIIIIIHDDKNTLWLWDEFGNSIAEGNWKESKEYYNLNFKYKNKQRAKIKGSMYLASLERDYLGKDGYLYLRYSPKGKIENKIRYEKRDYLPE